MNLKQARTKLYMLSRANKADYPEEFIDDLINDALDHIAETLKLNSFLERRNSVAGQDIYVLDSDMGMVEKVEIYDGDPATGGKLKGIITIENPKDAAIAHGASQSRALPMAASIDFVTHEDGNGVALPPALELRLRPPLDTNGTNNIWIYGKRSLSSLTEDTDELPFPWDCLNDGAIYHGCYLLAMSQGEVPRMQMFKEHHEDHLNIWRRLGIDTRNSYKKRVWQSGIRRWAPNSASS
jgi:hypothetical protein